MASPLILDSSSSAPTLPLCSRGPPRSRPAALRGNRAAGAWARDGASKKAAASAARQRREPDARKADAGRGSALEERSLRRKPGQQVPPHVYLCIVLGISCH